MRSWLTAWLAGYRRTVAAPTQRGGAACAYADGGDGTGARSGGRQRVPFAPGAREGGAEDALALARHYALSLRALPPACALLIAPLSLDADTRAFLDSCAPAPCADLIASLLRRFMSLTDTNGMLGRGSMFVLSAAQAGELLRHGLAGAPGQGPLTLLDVGAGDGDVTARLIAGMEASTGGGRRVAATVTEASKPMGGRLRARGWAVHVGTHINASLLPGDGGYDVVSLLNLLDRCDHPGDMLADAARLIRPGSGRVLIALVLPFSEFVEDGTRRRAPYGPLPMAGARCGDGASFEDSLSAFLMRVVAPAGLVVERLARVPYLCRGDGKRRYYVLSDAILVLRRSTAAEKAAGVYTAVGGWAGEGDAW
jgi:hypothetical protein